VSCFQRSRNNSQAYLTRHLSRTNKAVLLQSSVDLGMFAQALERVRGATECVGHREFEGTWDGWKGGIQGEEDVRSRPK